MGLRRALAEADRREAAAVLPVTPGERLVVLQPDSTGKLIDGAPLRPDLLRAALSVCVHCPVYGAANLAPRCPHAPSFVGDVPLEEPTSMATSLPRAAG
jgi:hypothetical protein